MEQPLLVRQHDAPLQWHEAVALVRSVTDALENGRLRSVPAPGELALERDGSLHLPPHGASTAADRGQLVAQLRELLGGLLSLDAPLQLRMIADGGEGSPPLKTLAEFRQAMVFFERPTHEIDRRALAARLDKIQEERKFETEVERLRRKAREQDTPLAATSTSPVIGRRFFRKALIAAAVVLVSAAVGLLVGAGVEVAIFPAPEAVGKGGAAESEVQPRSGQKGLVERLRAAAESAFGTPATPPEPTVATVGKSAPASQRRKPPPRRGATSTSPSPRPRPADPSGAVLLELAPLQISARSWSPPELRPMQYSSVIHDHSDAGVIPPVLLRPHLPSVGTVGGPGWEFGAVEVIVSEDGRVEQVRLVSTSAERRYYDAMILAAIKAWVFRPASRSGQPVRYRLSIQLT